MTDKFQSYVDSIQEKNKFKLLLILSKITITLPLILLY